MLWFDGPADKLVERVKSTNSFLLIFIRGYDTLTEEYESCLKKVTGLQDGTCVGYEVTKDSDALQHLEQIYGRIPVPSVYVIQNNGYLFHTVSTHKTHQISESIDKAVEKLNAEVKERLDGEQKKTKSSVCEQTNKRSECVNPSVKDIQERLNEIRAFPRFLLVNPPSGDSESFPSLPKRQKPKIHSARIQFRLPNNDTPSWEFPDLATLKDVRAYITEKVDLPQTFKFLRAYPRTVFSTRDERKTLSDLSLTPSATLFIVPIKVEDKDSQANPNDLVSRPHFISIVLDVVLIPLFAFFRFLKKHIFRTRVEMENDEDVEVSGSSSNGVQTRRKFGSNIHGFGFRWEDSDSEHPDNGNSTQQKYKKK